MKVQVNGRLSKRCTGVTGLHSKKKKKLGRKERKKERKKKQKNTPRAAVYRKVFKQFCFHNFNVIFPLKEDILHVLTVLCENWSSIHSIA